MTTDASRRVALVTGGASGIGAAVARRLSEQGNSVVTADVAQDDEGRSIAVTDLDVRDVRAWQRVVTRILRDFGRLDVLVNAAGIQGDIRQATLADCKQQNWEHVIEVNLTGAFLGCQAVLPTLSTGGSIVNISSLASYYPTAYNVAYGVSKGGLTQLTKTVATVAAPRVRCNSVHPGVIATPMINDILAATSPTDPSETGSDTSFIDRIPLGRTGTADEVAAVVAFLASEDASFVTGAEYSVDGGSRLVR